MVGLDWNMLVNSMINGAFVGMGFSVGVWLVTKHFISHIETLESKLKNGSGKNERT